MSITAGVGACERVISTPEVMDKISRKFREHLADFDSFLTAFGTVAEEGVGGIADYMEPSGFAFAAHSGFVGVEDGRLDQSGADFIHYRGELRRAFGHGLDDAAVTGAVMKKVLINFRRAGTRDDLADIEVGHSGLYGRAILGGRSDIFGELCSHTAAAIWTKFTCSLIFGDL